MAEGGEQAWNFRCWWDDVVILSQSRDGCVLSDGVIRKAESGGSTNSRGAQKELAWEDETQVFNYAEDRRQHC